MVGYRTDEMPAFYSRESGLSVDVRVERPDEIVSLFEARRALKLEGATLVTVPIPLEAEVSREWLEEVLAESLAEAADKQILGRDVTPFLLSRMGEISGGATLRANIALLENNARIAADVAVALTG